MKNVSRNEKVGCRPPGGGVGAVDWPHEPILFANTPQNAMPNRTPVAEYSDATARRDGGLPFMWFRIKYAVKKFFVMDCDFLRDLVKRVIESIFLGDDGCAPFFLK